MLSESQFYGFHSDAQPLREGHYSLLFVESYKLSPPEIGKMSKTVSGRDTSIVRKTPKKVRAIVIVFLIDEALIQANQ